MSTATFKIIATLIAGVAGSISGALIAEEPRTLVLTLCAVSLGSLSTGILAWVHGPQPGTKAKLKKAVVEATTDAVATAVAGRLRD